MRNICYILSIRPEDKTQCFTKPTPEAQDLIPFRRVFHRCSEAVLRGIRETDEGTPRLPKRLKIALIYSFGVNEDEPDTVAFSKMRMEDTDKLEKVREIFWMEAIKDYNWIFRRIMTIPRKNFRTTTRTFPKGQGPRSGSAARSEYVPHRFDAPTLQYAWGTRTCGCTDSCRRSLHEPAFSICEDSSGTSCVSRSGKGDERKLALATKRPAGLRAAEKHEDFFRLQGKWEVVRGIFDYHLSEANRQSFRRRTVVGGNHEKKFIQLLYGSRS